MARVQSFKIILTDVKAVLDKSFNDFFVKKVTLSPSEYCKEIRYGTQYTCTVVILLSFRTFPHSKRRGDSSLFYRNDGISI